jgi:hypothetical protein
LGHPAKAGGRVAGRLAEPIHGVTMMLVAIDCQRHPYIMVAFRKSDPK